MHGGSGRAVSGNTALQTQPSVLSLPARWKSQQPVGAGLSNLGNSCYLNSTLQCLAYVPPLAHLCLGGGHSSSCLRAAAAAPGGAALPARGLGPAAAAAQPCTFCIIERQLAAQLRGSRASAVSPSEMVRNLHLFGRSFVRGRQEDSHELLTAVLDVMERDSRKAAVALGAPKGCRTIVEELFQGRWQSQVRCLGCGHESNTYESFATLPLDIGQARTVTEGLRSFTEAERLDGSNKYRCDRCRQLVAAVKQTTIWDDPNVLVLHLKRFDAAGGGGMGLLGPGGAKISRHVAFPEALDLAPHMTPPAARRRAEQQQQAAEAATAAAGNEHAHPTHQQHQQRHGEVHANGNGAVGSCTDGSAEQGHVAGLAEAAYGRSVYGLTGVLVHQGTSLHSGHYYAYVRDSSGGWSCMNDSQVYGTSLDQVRQEQAYLLFYTRQTMKAPRPVPAPTPAPTPAATATVVEGPAPTLARAAVAAAAGAATVPARKVYGPQLPVYAARGSVATAAAANGVPPPGSAGEGPPLPQRPPRTTPLVTPSARLPAKIVVSPRATPVVAAVGPAAATAAAAAKPGAAGAAAAAAPLANGHAAAAAAASGGSGAASAPLTSPRGTGAAAAPEARKRKRADGDDDGGGGDKDRDGAPAGADANAEAEAEDVVRASVVSELAGLKACASWSAGVKRLRLSLEGRLRESAGVLAGMREAVLGLRRAGLSLGQVLAMSQDDPRRRSLHRLVPAGVLQHGAEELRKLLAPMLVLFAALGGPVPVLLL